jgi:hypothetical protein
MGKLKDNFFTWMLTVIVIALILLSCWLLRGDRRLPSIPKPTVAKDCTSEENSGSFTCKDKAEYTISLANVPEGVTPRMLQVSAIEEERLRSLPTDGTCVVSIAGNLVFYDNGDNLVTSFPEPITLTLNYTTQDALLLQPDINKFFKVSANPKVKECLDSNSVAKVDNIVPIYLYAPAFDTTIQIWKPFQNYTINEDDKTMTVEFLNWGDRQIGGGTKPP